MSKKMLINASHPEENRVAIVVDGVLSELDIEIAGQEQTKGNIYKAVVVRVETGLQAAFVDYGAEKLGFLQIGEIHPSLYPSKDDSNSRPRINEILQRGQEILVQIVKEERGNKGAALTTNLSIPGRYMVLMPDSTTKGVSRKIQDDPERKKLKRTMAELNLPERMGYIVRTAGIGKEKEELKRDFDYLVRLFEGIIARKDQIKAPTQLYQESNLVIRSIRDYFSTEMDEVLIDEDKVFKDAKDFFTLVMPELAHLVKQHRERRPIFSRYQIEEQIDGLAKNQTPLPSGGSIVIDQTEALVAIDVNSGKMSSESGIEATASKTNLEAATEIGRQLRLRDLGGLVVIDFIDMRDRKHIREVEQELRNALRDDKAKVSVGRISQFGLMEMSRQRLKPTLSVGSYLECPHCHGVGRIKSAENQSVSLLRQIHAAASKGHIGHIEAKVPINVANDLLNSKRQSLVELEKRLNLKVTILGYNDMLPGQLELEIYKREKNGEDNRDIAPVTHANQIERALAAAEQTEILELGDQANATETPTAAAEAEGVEKEETKSRRRRRRRKKKTDRRTDAGNEQEAASAQTESIEQDSSQPAAATDSDVKKTDEKLPVEVTSSEPTQSDTSVKTVTAAENHSETPEAEKKPRRRPRRPAAKKAVEKAQESAPTAQAPAPETTSEAPAAEEKPKRRTRRPAAKKTVEKTPTSEPAAQAPAPETTSEAPAAEEKPKRRTRRPAAKKAVEKTPASEPSTQAPAPETTSEAPAAEEKPKRRTRRPAAKKAVEKTPASEPAAQAPAADTNSKAPAAEEKPKRRTRRPTAKKAVEKAPASEPAAQAPAADTNSEAPAAEEKPKRRTRRPAAKKAVEKDPAGTKTTEIPTASKTNESTVAEEKPKRRPGRPRKVKTVAPEVDQES